jgi:hypothetical protein
MIQHIPKELEKYIHPVFGIAVLYQNSFDEYILENCIHFKGSLSLNEVRIKIINLGFTLYK